VGVGSGPNGFGSGPDEWSTRPGIHRADAELALGREPAFEPSIAADGVSEFFDNLWRARVFRREIGNLRGHGETLRFVATDTTGQWTVHLDDTLVRARREVARRVPRADVRIGGAAVDLYLLVWHRRDVDHGRFRITGDRILLDRWQAGSAV
jgi:MDMPI C-terminal domain